MAALTLTTETYRDKVHGAWMGKAIGLTLGAAQRGRKTPGIQNFYSPVPGQPVASAALDFPLVWLAALEETGPAITPEDLAVAWLEHLDYQQDEFAYAALNLRRGLPPPASGAHANWFRHATGGAMRADFWAMLAPGAPQVAAAYAYHDAKLDHSEDGAWATMFLSALGSAAFFLTDPLTLLTIGLAMIPKTCRTARAVKTALAAAQRAASWLEARESVLNEVGHKNYTDAPQNMGFFTLGLFYGAQDFGSSLCAGVNCGYDSEVVGGALGAVWGILRGRSGLPENWTAPLGDHFVPGIGLRDLDAPYTLTEVAERVVALGRRVVSDRCPDVQIGDAADLLPSAPPAAFPAPPSSDAAPSDAETAAPLPEDSAPAALPADAPPDAESAAPASAPGEPIAAPPASDLPEIEDPTVPSAFPPRAAEPVAQDSPPAAAGSPSTPDAGEPDSFRPQLPETAPKPQPEPEPAPDSAPAPAAIPAPEPMAEPAPPSAPEDSPPGLLAPQPVSEAPLPAPQPVAAPEPPPAPLNAPAAPPLAADPLIAIAWADNTLVKPLLITPSHAFFMQAGPFEVVMDAGDSPTIGVNMLKTLAFSIVNRGETPFSGRVQLLAPSGWQISAPPNLGQRQFIAANGGAFRADYTIRINEGQGRIEIANTVLLRFTPESGGSSIEADFLLLGASCWRTVGPFANFDGEGFDRSYPPEDRPGLQETYLNRMSQLVSWEKRVYPEPVMDVESLFRGSSGVFYGYTILRSPTARDARLVANTDTGVKVWLNGGLALRRHSREVFRPVLGSGPWAADVTLQAGDNPVLVKWVRGSEPIEFSLTVSDRYGRGLPEVGNASW